MKEYDGPVFQNREHKQREVSKFKQLNQRSATRRSFKPVSESRQPAYETAYQESSQERFEHLKQGQVQKETASDTPTPSEAYDIPFKREYEEPAMLRKRSSLSENVSTESVDLSESTPRSVYEPAFQRKKRQSEIKSEEVAPLMEVVTEWEEATPFQPKQMPQPYRQAQELAEVDLQTRELAKRLVKSSDSFLLFEEE